MTRASLSSEPFESHYEQIAETVEKAMEGYLCRDSGVPKVLQEAMLYSLHAGGKRVRPVMVVLACEACGGEDVLAYPAAAAIEMVHTYSLIHDDLPAMDDDDLRRGKPTNHKVFGEGLAILAGDALLTQAFAILGMHVEDDRLSRRLVRELSDAAGAAGMIGGQVADMTWEDQANKADLDAVQYIHTHKTGMLFRAAARMGGWCGRGSKQQVDSLGDFGLKIGLAFQIVDDLLDITGIAEEMGKQTQKDEQAGKLTYPGVAGVDQSREDAAVYMEEAIEAIEGFSEKGRYLRDLARMLVDRKK